jgi:hypothetical protein
LFIAGKSNVFTTFPARSRELRGEVDDDWDFLELLEVTRAQQASDPRDYIFALLGHPCALVDGIPIVEPDYSKGAQDLYFEVSVKIMRQTRSLRLLSAVHHGDDSGLGGETVSWIPTWSRDLYVLSREYTGSAITTSYMIRQQAFLPFSNRFSSRKRCESKALFSTSSMNSLEQRTGNSRMVLGSSGS